MFQNNSLHERLYQENQNYEYMDPASIEQRQIQIKRNVQKSLQKYTRLPEKTQILQDPFGDIQQHLKNTKNISNDLKETFRIVRHQLIKQFKIYRNPKDFIFQLPQSKFPAVKPGETNTISYERKNIYEEQDTFRDRLSPEQIQQIRQTGQFKVKSNRQYITLPYVWKINQCIFKGKKNIASNWNQTIECAFSILYNSFHTFVRGIPEEVQNLRQIPIDFFSVLFGRKALITLLNVDYHRQIAKQFWLQVMNTYYFKCKQWGSDIWEYFYVNYRSELFQQIQQKNEALLLLKTQENQKQMTAFNKQCSQSNQRGTKLRRVHQSFLLYWSKVKKKIFMEITEKYSADKKENQFKKEENQSQLLIKQKKKASDEQILSIFDDRKFTIYLQYIQQNLPKQNVPIDVIHAIICLLTILNIFKKRFRLYETQKNIQNQRIRTQIRQNHPILSLNSDYFEKQVKNIFQPLQKNMKQQFYVNLYRDANLQKKVNNKQKQVYQLWLSFIANYDLRIQAKEKQIPQIKGPQKKFESFYYILPPYQVKQVGNQQNPYFTLEKQKKMEVTTQSYFWKISLYCMRLKCWTMNCFVSLLYFSWTGPFGLRCLFGIQNFIYDQYLLDYQTGRIGNLTRQTFLGVFSKVLDGISESRRAFEALPDRGLFGKNLSRICNLFECYIFRFLIVGVIITLMLYPVAIILVSTICFAFILTIWIWVPLIIIVVYLFNIFVFEYESNYRDQCVIKSVPMISLLLRFLFIMLKMLLYTILFFIISPIGAIIVTLFAIFQYILRSFTDCIMICLISTCGRTPSNNSSIATKISGPGMSRQYYMSINQEDVYILTQAQIQRIFMEKYNRIMVDKINEPVVNLTQTMNAFLKPYNQNFVYYNNNNSINENVSSLAYNFSSTYNNYMARFPNRPYNVRFTREQLDIYLDNSAAIVKNFANKSKIQNWIFEHFQILEDWDELTRRIWMRVFQCGQQIFQPLQQIDQRFKLQDQYQYYDKKYGGNQRFEQSSNFKMKQSVNTVLNALQGEVMLNHKKANFSPFNHNLMNRQYNGEDLNTILNLNACNSKTSLYFDRQNPTFLFFANLNIKEIAKNDTYVRLKAIKNIEKNNR